MVAVYTLADGSQVQMPEGLSDEQAQNIIYKTFPDRASAYGGFYDIEKQYNTRDGVPDVGVRFGQALARGNPAEIKAALDEQVGEGNWGIADNGGVYVTPDGLRARGIEPKDNRPVFIDGTSNNLYDLVDIAPEIAAGVAATAAEVILAPTPVKGAGGLVARGFLSTLSSLAGRSAAAAAGDVAANLGLEAVQVLQGRNREDVGEILTRVGSEGAAVAGASLALGLPFAAIGPLAGRISKAAEAGVGKTTNRGMAVTAESAQVARAQAIDDFIKAGLKPEEAKELVPYVTLKHMLGDQGSLSGRLFTVLEGVGAKNMGDALPAKAVQFLEKYHSLYRAAELEGLSPIEIAQRMRNSLNQTERNLVNKTLNEIDTFYDKFKAKTGPELDVSEITNLISTNLQRQLKFGIEQFKSPSLYGDVANPNPALNLSGLSKVTVSRDNVAATLNKIADDLGVTAEDALNTIDSLSGQSGSIKRIANNVEFKDGRAVGKKGKVEDSLKDIPEEYRNFAKQSKEYLGSVAENTTDVNALDLYNIQQGLRGAISSRNIGRNDVRQAAVATGTLIDTIDKTVGKGFSEELNRVNGLYKKFISPFNRKSLRKVTESTAQNPQEFVQDLVSGRKSSLFREIVEDLDAALKGIDEIGGKASDVANADELLGMVATQYMRHTRNMFDLSDMAGKSIDEVRANAKAAYKHLNKLENTSFEKKFKKTYDRLFDNSAYRQYKAALKKLADGKPEGLAELGEMLTFKEAQNFVDRIARLGDNIAEADIKSAVAEIARHRAIDPEGAKFYQDLFYSQLTNRLYSIGGAEASAQNTLLKKWADDLIRANNKDPASLKELFGPQYYDPTMRMANVIRGALDIDPSAGSISAASVPFNVFRNILQGSVLGALKPLSVMYTMKGFGPGGPLWKKLNARLGFGQAPEKVESLMKPAALKAVKAAQKSASLAMSGRNGLLAASVGAYMNEQHQNNPIGRDVPVVPVRASPVDVGVEQEQQNQLAMEQQLGAAMSQFLRSMQSASGAMPPVANIGQQGLAQGAAIARGR